MIERTRKTIEMGRTAISAHAKDAQLLAEKKVTEQIAENYMNEVFKQDSEYSEEAKQKANAQSALDAFRNAPGQNLKSAQMTAWGLLTAVTYTADRLGKTPDSRLRQAWFGPNAKIKKRALELALKLL
jgi:regulator of protease activity HflC (stomatin/prohibitin superfamily)